jgi:hypothetical protein
VKVTDSVLPLAAPIGLLNVWLPVLAGAPGHAEAVQELVVCCTPVSLVHVTALPTATVTDSGLKQNSVPPPEQAPSLIVTAAPEAADACALVSVTVVAGVRAARISPTAANPAIAAVDAMRVLSECLPEGAMK